MTETIKRSVGLVDRLGKAEFGEPYTSDYVFDETVTTPIVRTGGQDVAVSEGKLILGLKEESIPSLARLVRVDERSFSAA